MATARLDPARFRPQNCAMDRTRFSTIAHAAHDFCSPLDWPVLAELIGRAGLQPGNCVLDVGCGKAELLLRLIRSSGVSGVGVDTNAVFLEEGRRQARSLGVELGEGAGRLRLLQQSAADFQAAPHSFALACCVGAAHALGDPGKAIASLAAWTRPGGHVLLGEAFWQREPAADYLAVVGAARSDHGTHAELLALGAAQGLRLIAAQVSRQAAWDRYEQMYAAGVEDYVARQPEDPDGAAMRERIRTWRAAYLHNGRGTFGFGLCLWRRP